MLRVDIPCPGREQVPRECVVVPRVLGAARFSTLPGGYFCDRDGGEKSHKHEICGCAEEAPKILLTRRGETNRKLLLDVVRSFDTVRCGSERFHPGEIRHIVSLQVLHIYIYIYIYTGCFRRNSKYFRRW